METDRDRLLVFLHQFARDVVDRGDVIGIDRVAQAEAEGNQASRQEQRMVAKRDDSPEPSQQICDAQDGVEADDLWAQVAGAVVEHREHRPQGSVLVHRGRRMCGVMRGALS